MTAAASSEGDDSAWEVVDEAVRQRLWEVLQTSAENFVNPDLMGRIDPISLLPALARTALSVAGRPDRLIATMTRETTELIKASGSAVVRATRRIACVRPETPTRQAFRRPDVESERLVLVAAGELSRVRTLLAVDRPRRRDDRGDQAEGRVRHAVVRRRRGPDELLPRQSCSDQASLRVRRPVAGQRRAQLHQGPDQQRRLAAAGGDRVHNVGQNMAVSPGKVVFRNDLMELIQYAPSTPEVHEIPLLFSPPWINKYYVMDLAPGRSLVEWAVQHGHTVFMISYRNPDHSMSKISMDDYLLSGPMKAIDVITEITGTE